MKTHETKIGSHIVRADGEIAGNPLVSEEGSCCHDSPAYEPLQGCHGRSITMVLILGGCLNEAGVDTND